MDGSTFSFYSKPEYFEQLVQRIGQAAPGSRVLLMTMGFDPAEADVQRLMDVLAAAADRGVNISLGVDAHDFLTGSSRPGPLWYHRQLPAVLHGQFKAKNQSLLQLSGHKNTQVRILNMPGRRFSLPIAGRSHIKAAIVGDYIMLGGCNLDRAADIDMMAGWSNKPAADELSMLLHSILQDGSVKHTLQGADCTLPLGADGKLLVDAGLPNQSLIFSEALALIDSAQRWLTITCQFFPNSITARHLHQAILRGVDVQIIYTNPRQHESIGGIGQRVSMLIERSRLPRSMFAGQLSPVGPFLHAKLIACDRGMMIGSHNYVRAGVRLGTAEIALYNPSELVAKTAVQKIQSQLS